MSSTSPHAPPVTPEDRGCLACRTAAGEFAREEVYRDDRVVAVVAHHAVNPGHLVVIPLEHVRNALTMTDALISHLVCVARDLARILPRVTESPSVMLLFNNEAPCQTLFHAHLHVVPRQSGDPLDFPAGKPVDAAERSIVAARIRAGMTESTPD